MQAMLMHVYPWLAPLAILVSAFAAWRYHRSVSAKRATLDFITSEMANTALVKASSHFRKLAHGDGSEPIDRSELIALARVGANTKSLAAGIDDVKDRANDSHIVDEEKKEKVDSLAKVSLFLNHCELVATAIYNHAMDEKMYKDNKYTAYLMAWEGAKSFVTERRDYLNRPMLYRNFQRLAKDWRDSPPDNL